MTFPGFLQQLPEGVPATLELLTALDQCWLTGFANLDAQHHQTLQGIKQIFAGTPLDAAIAESLAALQRYEFVEPHFVTLATIRAALQGSVFDALQHQVRSGLGRSELPALEDSATEVPEDLKIWLSSIQHWLMEVALVGYSRLDTATLTAFLPTLEQLQADPRLLRQSALLTGFLNELLGRVPIADPSTIPLYRWIDLWTRSMIGTLAPSPAPQTELVSGTFEILGLELRHHANLVSPTFYGLLTGTGQGQWVKLTLSAYKVNTIRGDEIWLLFPSAVPLLEAWSGSKTLQLSNVPCLPTGDLLWQGEGAVGKKFNLMARSAEVFNPTATVAFSSGVTPPLDRHPIQLAEPIFLQDYQVLETPSGLSLSWGEAGELPVALERLSSLSEVTPATIAESTQLFGLLQFDAGRWAVQPLSLTIKGKPWFAGQKAAKTLTSPPKTSTVATLQERSSRLLRQKR